jgi:undecaprenyl-diphosphatase
MDQLIARQANHFLLLHDGLEDLVSRFEQLSILLFAGCMVALFATFLLAPDATTLRWRRTAVAAAASGTLALACGGVIAALVRRPRPFVADPAAIHLFVTHAADGGFPSDHATAAFAIATAVVLRERAAGVPLLVAATLVALGRVAIGVHYPTDVIAGALLGAAAAGICATAVVRGFTDGLADRTGALIDRTFRRVTVPAGSG